MYDSLHGLADAHPCVRLDLHLSALLFSHFAEAGIRSCDETARRQHYSAGRMCLAVLGGESLEELQQLVMELFSGLPTDEPAMPSFQHCGQPFEARPPSFFSRCLHASHGCIEHQCGNECSDACACGAIAT